MRIVVNRDTVKDNEYLIKKLLEKTSPAFVLLFIIAKFRAHVTSHLDMKIDEKSESGKFSYKSCELL